jgi:signal transduction histidine kinase
MESTIDGKRYVLIASKLPDYPHLILVYARDISHIDTFRADVGRVFIILNAIVLLFLGVSIFILLKRLTKPISELITTTTKIAGGEYEKRVLSKRSDELGVLADSFNKMADSVEGHVAQLSRAAEEKQQFVDDLTHEMRTPLTSILGYAEYLQNVKSTEEERIVAAGHLFYMANRLNNLSEKLMDMTYLRNESFEMKLVCALDLLNQLHILTLPLLTSRNMTLSVAVDDVKIHGDETLLLSLLVNLVENAARASKSGAFIKVKVYGTDDGAVIEVIDSGRGLAEEEIEKISAPFYRVDKSRSREFGGIGLGLSIVSQIVAIHNAKLEIDSVQDIGTTVRICFLRE